MKILVTGGAGFIGSHLVDALINKGHRVSVIDNLVKGDRKNVNAKSHFLKLDITSNNVSDYLKKTKPQIIFHLAAQSSITSSLNNPKLDLEVNLMGTLNLIEAAKKNNVEKVIFASSAAVYKPTNKIPIVENERKSPISLYGASKLSSEFFLDNYSLHYGLSHVALRFANVYGPRQNSSAEGGVVAIFINQMISGKAITINGDGKQTRDFVYVQDVIGACLDSLDKKINGSFNVGTAQETSILKLHERLQKLLGVRSKKKFKKNSSLEVKRSALSFEKITKIAQWKPQIDLDDGLIKTINYFKKNK